MCAFEINMFSVKREYHRFSTDDFALIGIGLANYNLSSVNKTFAAPTNPDIVEFFGGDQGSNVIAKLLGGSAQDMAILAYDDVDKKYRLKSGWANIKKINTNKYKDHTEPPDGSLSGFLQSWNDVQNGIITNTKSVNGYNLIANRIQNSLSGCVTFDTTLNILGNSSRKSKIKVFVLNSKDNDSSRTIALNGSPLISAIPQTAEGMRYSFTNTTNANAGVYVGPSSNDGDDPRDKVAGQLRLAWDPTTKTWESGTQQILARLVDSIDAPDIPKITRSELLNLSQAQVYNVNVEDNPIMGKPQKGRAMVLSIENGNPNLFGPNFRGQCNNNKKSMILAVNRSSKSYKEGTLVVCSFINGEWIIISGEGDISESKKKLTFGRFEYQQYILPANLFFTSPNSPAIGGKLLPNIWSKKIRDDYYLKRFGSSDSDSLTLNLLAKTIVGGGEKTPAQELSTIMEGSPERLSLVMAARTNSTIDGVSALNFINNNYCTGDKIYQYTVPYDEQRYAVPKNVLAKSNRLLALNLPLVQNVAPEDYTDKMDVPLFWGILFPDGFQAGQASKFINDTSLGLKSANKKIFNEDPNLKELTAGAGMSLPPLSEDQQIYRYVYNEKSGQTWDNKDPLSLVRNAGGLYRPVSLFAGVINDVVKLDNYISLKGVPSNIDLNRITGGIYGLEPVNPRRLQFSPMSIEFLYMNSILLNEEFNKDLMGGSRIPTFVNEIKNQDLPTSVSAGVGDNKMSKYAEFLFNQIPSNPSTYSDAVFPGNSHNISALSFEKAFSGDRATILLRHPAPVSVVDGGFIIPPTFGSNRRSSAMPIMAVKNVIKTNADSLTFTLTQFFGNPQKKVVVPGSGPGITLLPIGGGIGWSTPGTPVGINSFPQWGDSNRTDDIDSFGTLALHARVFEHWPENQTIFLGPIYTPLHFNPNIEDDGFDYSYDTSTNTIIKTQRLNNDGDPVQPTSSVDFTEPSNLTSPSTLLAFGTTVTSGDLAPFDLWKTNTIRRGQLLSDGGFAYYQQVIIVDNINIDTDNKGAGYTLGDSFQCADGTTFKVNVDADGKITQTYDIQKNHTNNIIKDPEKYLDITTLDSQPDYLGNTGGGATFKMTFKIGKIIKHDPAPLEVSGPYPVLLTSKSNSTDPKNITIIDSINTKTVETSNGSSTANEFDIFYFFHNDPTMYSIGPSLQYNNTNAQYVISEVNPT